MLTEIRHIGPIPASLPWITTPRTDEVGQHPIIACVRCGLRRKRKTSRDVNLCRDCRSFVIRHNELDRWVDARRSPWRTSY